jgi:hypothetical protein
VLPNQEEKEMPQSPDNGTRITADDLRSLLSKAQNDPTFANELLTSPAATLAARNLRPDAHWVQFFSQMDPADLQKQINVTINLLDGEAEARG